MMMINFYVIDLIARW